MSLIQELIHLDLNKLKIKYSNASDSSYSFVLTTASGKLVAIGWHVEDQFNEKEYSFMDNKAHLLVNHSSAGLMTIHEWYTWPGVVFLINNRNIWHAEFNMAEPIGYIHNSLDLYIKNLKFNFPELRSESEIPDKKISTHAIESEQFQNSVLLMSAEIEELQSQVNQLIIENAQLKKKLKSLEESISPDSESV